MSEAERLAKLRGDRDKKFTMTENHQTNNVEEEDEEEEEEEEDQDADDEEQEVEEKQ